MLGASRSLVNPLQPVATAAAKANWYSAGIRVSDGSGSSGGFESRVFTLRTESAGPKRLYNTNRLKCPRNPSRAGIHSFAPRFSQTNRSIDAIVPSRPESPSCLFNRRKVSFSPRSIFFSPFRVHFSISFLVLSHFYSLSLFFFLFFSLHLSRMPRRIHFYRCARSFAFSRVDSPAPLSRPAIFL